MRSVLARKHHICKKCRSDIWSGIEYYPQRRGKAICFTCGSTPKKVSLLSKIKKWLKL